MNRSTMILRKEAVALLLLLFFKVWASTPLSNITKYLSHRNKDLILHYDLGDNVTFYYALCDRSHEELLKRTCILILESLAKDGTSNKKLCELQLRGKPSEPRYLLTRLNADDLVFAYKMSDERNRTMDRHRRYYLSEPRYYKEYLEVRVVRMSSCVHEVDKIVAYASEDKGSSQEIESLSLVPYNETNLRILYRNHRRCGTAERCLESYDAVKRQFSDDIGRFLPVRYEASVQLRKLNSVNNSSAEALMLETSYLADGAVSLLDLKARELYSLYYSWSEFELETRISSLATSRSAGAFGICRQAWHQPILDCSLFNGKGIASLGVAIDLRSTDVAFLKMHNLPKGGILLAIGYAKLEMEDFEAFDLLRIDAGGNNIEERNIMDLRCDLTNDALVVEFFDKRNFDYCFSVVCSWPKIQGTADGESRFTMRSECRNSSTIVDSETLNF